MSTEDVSVSAAKADELERGNWAIDGVHSFVTFTVEHFTVSFARGIASGPSGQIVIADDLLSSTVQASIDASTVTTGNANRDGKVKGPDVLDVENFPTIEYRSTGLRQTGDGYEMDGELTLRGVTVPQTLALTFHGTVTDMGGKTRLGLTAEGTINRADFGAGEWAHAPLASGGFMVPNKVKVVLDIEATKSE